MKKIIFIWFIALSFSSTLIAQEITVSKLWREGTFFSKHVDGFRSMKDGEYFTKISETGYGKAITKHAFKSYQGKGEVLVKLSDLKINGTILDIDDYEFNSDESKLLFTTNTESIYRRSYSAVYYLYDLSSKKLEALDSKHQPQTLAEYSPDGRKVSFIHQNNIYVKNLDNQEVTQVTTDGLQNAIINGTTDWVYEEEFAITKGFCWSPDSKNIAFIKFDERQVKEFNMNYFYDLYPSLYTFKYPKAGEDNSKVSLHIYQVNSKNTTPISLGEYEYIPRLKFSSNKNQLVVQTLNRHQNQLKYHLIDLDEKQIHAKVFFEEKSDTYVEIDDNLLILSDGNTILRTSESNGFNHIYALSFDGKSRQITQGNWDVIEFFGINEKSKIIYYASAEKGAINKAIYSIKMDGSDKTTLSKEQGYNEAEFSTGMKYFIKTYSNASTPPVFTLCNNKGKELDVLEDNQQLKNTIQSYHFVQKEFVQFQGAEKPLNGWILKPSDFDSTKQYPVYMTVYGGPGSNMVADEWGGADFAYHQLLVQKGYIVVSVDPRGTMYQGAAFKKSTYLQLGKLETEDVIAVGIELGKRNYIDAARIGIQGWSYGGFMTSLAMTKGAHVFKMGIAVAPVTNWKYYDNIYTERFMRTPEENPNGYNDNSPINFVKELKGKYLLIHGSGDDNVHYQNTMEMITALVAANKQFDHFIYPNKNHGIYGGNTRNHLFTMMLNYTLNNL
jgi:dipeptidyl-peptidase 4